MAVIKALQVYQGVPYCLVIDGSADTFELVSSLGYDLNEASIDFRLAYYDEMEIGAPATFYARFDLETNTPVGIMVERFSGLMNRRTRLGRRRNPSPLETLEFLAQFIAEQLPTEPWAAGEPLFEAAPATYAPPDFIGSVVQSLGRQNGERITHA